MAKNEQAKATIYLDGKQAEAALDALKNKAGEVRKAMKQAQKAGDQVKFKKLERELKGLEAAQRSLRKETFDYEKVLRNLNGAAPNDLKKALRTVEIQLGKMKRSDPGFNQKAAQAKLFRTELSKVNKQLRSQQTFIGRAADSFNKYFSVITAGAATFAGFILGTRKAVDTFNDFEETSDNLQALTGLTAEQMEYLEKQAENTSHTIVEGGVRIKQGATDILDAYTLVGSQRPELLKNKEALHEVTQESIILSEAAKMELEPAAAALTNTLNQFNESADQSRRVINILAAGSQAGAGNIEYISQAMEKMGTTANLMEMSIEQSTGAIEMAAPYYKRAEMAGNSLDKVLLKMKANQTGYRDGVFDLNRAIDELRVRYANGESAAKIFGVEHAKMGELLVLNQKELNRYTDAVTGTNKAIEQASINTDNNNAKLAQARNERQIAIKELGEKLSPLMTHIVSKSSMMFKVISILVDFFTKYGRVLITTTAAITAYYIATKIAAGWTKIHYAYLVTTEAVTKAYAFTTNVLTGKIKLATVAQKAWNLVQKANPIGLVAGVVAGAIVALIAYTKKLQSVTAAQKILNEVETTAQQNIVEQKLKVEELLNTGKDEKRSLDERKKALEELNKISPEYFGNLTLEKINSEEATEATKKYTEALLQQARVEAAREKLIELEKERIEAMQSGTDYQNKWYQTAWNAVKSFGNAVSFASNQAVTGAKNAAQAEQEYIDKKEALIGLIGKEKEAISESSGTGGSGGAGNNITKETLEKSFKEEQNLLKEQFLLKKLTQGDYNREMYALELAHLVSMRELYRQHGEDFVEVEGQIIDKKIAWQQQLDSILQNSNQITEKLLQDDKAMFADLDSDMDKYMEDYQKKLDKQTEATIEAENKKREAREKAKEAQITQAVEAGAAAVENAKTVEEAGKAILNTIRDQIKAYIAEAVATQALKALKSVPFPFNIAAAVTAGGAASFLFNQLIPEFSSGGPTGPGGKQEVAGVVHKKEYVIPSEGTENPTLKPFIDIIEIARRNGSLARLDLRPVMQILSPQKQLYAGGFVSGGAGSSAGNPAQPYTMTVMDVDKFEKAVDRMMEWEPNLVITDVKKRLDRLERINEQSKLN